VLAETENTPVAAMGDLQRHLYGVQFHPEVAHTPFGMHLLRQFLYAVCGCKGDWTMRNFIDESVARIRAQVGSERVLCAVSGGVDSCTVAALVQRAIGEQLTCIFVDHGLMRAGEAEQVRTLFTQHFPSRLIFVDARERFLQRLQGVVDPEQKRKVIGEEFVRVFEEHADAIGQCRYLAQGTLYPDVIESGTRLRSENQDAPQCRRAARLDAHGTHRAAALPVQGRGAPRRAGVGAAPRNRVAAAVPWTGTWRCACWAR
jgi:GMP synthase (glutamine-hydrolysing)